MGLILYIIMLIYNFYKNVLNPVLFILEVVGNWKIFGDLDIAKWKSLIPGLSKYELGKRFDKPIPGLVWAVGELVYFLVGVYTFYTYVQIRLAQRGGFTLDTLHLLDVHSQMTGLQRMAIPLVLFGIIASWFVIKHLCEFYDKGIVYQLGLTVLPRIFIPILLFTKGKTSDSSIEQNSYTPSSRYAAVQVSTTAVPTIDIPAPAMQTKPHKTSSIRQEGDVLSFGDLRVRTEGPKLPCIGSLPLTKKDIERARYHRN
ncbi:hypothetical protein [Atopobium fossor]|uniref:hypothetical protein n=1 Tax=Atopobium fossor TaxID=39487 RepID=UPI00041E3289|nr:hypothetical protein [Atopobium fossor]